MRSLDDAADASTVVFLDRAGQPVADPDAAATATFGPPTSGPGGAGGAACDRPGAEGPAGLAAPVGCCTALPPTNDCAALEACAP
ncbi:MAG: hypothetical protein H6704_02550 [Myxococcales bacterium]|nr:hypothetical protein [Myxococcales bacterium]